MRSRHVHAGLYALHTHAPDHAEAEAARATTAAAEESRDEATVGASPAPPAAVEGVRAQAATGTRRGVERGRGPGGRCNDARGDAVELAEGNPL